MGSANTKSGKSWEKVQYKVQDALHRKSRELKLVQLNLEEINEDAVMSLTAFQKIHLNRNRIAHLPKNIGLLSLFLEELIIDNNSLTAIPDSIGELNVLAHLSLRNNCLAQLPQSFRQLTSLTHLSLDSNYFTTIPEPLTMLPLLTTLSMGGNRLETIPAHISQLQSLTSIDFQLNKLTSINSLVLVPTLTTINLTGNRLSALPSDLSRLSCLRQLILWDNKLSSLPDILSPTLTELIVRHNLLEALPRGIGALTRLEVLDIGQNHLRFLPFELAALRGCLRDLLLDDNPWPPAFAEVLRRAADRAVVAAVVDFLENAQRHSAKPPSAATKSTTKVTAAEIAISTALTVSANPIIRHKAEMTATKMLQVLSSTSTSNWMISGQGVSTMSTSPRHAAANPNTARPVSVRKGSLKAYRILKRQAEARDWMEAVVGRVMPPQADLRTVLFDGRWLARLIGEIRPELVVGIDIDELDPSDSLAASGESPADIAARRKSTLYSGQVSASSSPLATSRLRVLDRSRSQITFGRNEKLIRCFLDGALALGVDENELFAPRMLLDGSNMIAVVDIIHALAHVVGGKTFSSAGSIKAIPPLIERSDREFTEYEISSAVEQLRAMEEAYVKKRASRIARESAVIFQQVLQQAAAVAMATAPPPVQSATLSTRAVGSARTSTWLAAKRRSGTSDSTGSGIDAMRKDRSKHSARQFLLGRLSMIASAGLLANGLPISSTRSVDATTVSEATPTPAVQPAVSVQSASAAMAVPVNTDMPTAKSMEGSSPTGSAAARVAARTDDTASQSAAATSSPRSARALSAGTQARVDTLEHQLDDLIILMVEKVYNKLADIIEESFLDELDRVHAVQAESDTDSSTTISETDELDLDGVLSADEERLWAQLDDVLKDFEEGK